MGAHSDDDLLLATGARDDPIARSSGLTTLLDVRDLAAVLGVSDRYVYRLVNERRVPFVKLGHYVRFDPDEIQAWLDAARVRETVRRG